MNYYNPYVFTTPYMYSAQAIPKVGLLARIFGNKANLTTILTGTQKTLNIVNQVIPIIKQAGPMINNAKTMFKIMNEFKRIDQPLQQISNKKISNKSIDEENTKQKEPVIYEAGPMFFQ